MSSAKTSVRLMAPFSMRCASCSQFIYKGTKFNARKTNTGQKYLSIAIIQLSFRCSSCSNEIILRTNPEIGDYTVAEGADRNLDLRIENEPQQNIGNLAPERRSSMDRSPKISAQRTPKVGLNLNSQASRGVRKLLPKPKARKHLVKKLHPLKEEAN